MYQCPSSISDASISFFSVASSFKQHRKRTGEQLVDQQLVDQSISQSMPYDGGIPSALTPTVFWCDCVCVRVCVRERERQRLVGQSELRQGREGKVNHILLFFFPLLYTSDTAREGRRVWGCVVSRRVTIITAIKCHIIGMRRTDHIHRRRRFSSRTSIHWSKHPNPIGKQRRRKKKTKTKNIILYVLFVLSQKRCNISKPAKVP